MRSLLLQSAGHVQYLMETGRESAKTPQKERWILMAKHELKWGRTGRHSGKRELYVQRHELIRNTCCGDPKEALPSSRPEVEPGEKVSWKHMRKAIILVNNVVLIVHILVLILEDARSRRRLRRCRGTSWRSDVHHLDSIPCCSSHLALTTIPGR